MPLYGRGDIKEIKAAKEAVRFAILQKSDLMKGNARLINALQKRRRQSQMKQSVLCIGKGLAHDVVGNRETSSDAGTRSVFAPARIRHRSTQGEEAVRINKGNAKQMKKY